MNAELNIRERARKIKKDERFQKICNEYGIVRSCNVFIDNNTLYYWIPAEQDKFEYGKCILACCRF